MSYPILIIPCGIILSESSIENLKQVKIEGLDCLVKINHNDADSVIFLHGNSMSKYSFRHLNLDRLNNFNLYFFDLPGHGRSCSLQKYSLISISKLISEAIRTIDQPENIILVGHSLGGNLAFHCLEYFTPKKIISFGAPVLTNPFPVRAYKNNSCIELFLKNQLDQAEKIKLFQTMCYLKKNTDLNIDFDQLNQVDSIFKQTFFQSIQENEFLDEKKLLKNYNGILNFIIGEEDMFIDSDYFKELSKDFSKNVQFDFVTSGHYLQHDLPEYIENTLNSKGDNP